MKNYIFLALAAFLGIAGLSAQTAPGGRENTRYVAVKSAALKASAGVFAKTVQELALGDTLTVISEKGDWTEVSTSTVPARKGWVSSASLSTKRVLSSSRAVSASELALAGKGFSAELETAYRDGNRLDFSVIDKSESQNISDDELLLFLTEGHLSRGK
jgi:SH3-like domain-containing protein